jgi:cupin fold WbuC family metalloprotein
MTKAIPILNSIAIQKSPEVFHAKTWGLNWGTELIEELKIMALKSELKRARLCLHPDTNDIHQEMLIVMHKNAIESPQRRTTGFDTKIIIEGEATIKYYSQEGVATQEFLLGKNSSTYIHTCNDEFHNLEITSEWFVFLEILKGPFTSTTTILANFPTNRK